MMIEFQWPLLLLALPLPLLVSLLLPAARAAEAALRVPDLEPFSVGRMGTVNTRYHSHLVIFAVLAWVALVTAAARPVWHGEPIELPISGRDLMLAVDLSESMTQQDFILRGQQVNRLVATQAIAGEFIARRVGDRLGLILFGERAYIQTPLTFDRTTVRQLLDEAVIGLAGRTTAIGDAIGLAVKRLRRDKEGERVLILLTDGANTAGEVEPLKAAELAAAEGLKIYTIGIGADTMTVRSLLGNRRINPSRDLDEKTLRGIAEATSGRYYRARDSDALERIYQTIDELEPVERERQIFRPYHALFHWPLGLALVLAGLVAITKGRREQ